MTTVYRVLGPIRVVRGGVERSVGGPRERAVLAKLLLDADRVVSVDRLIDAVWQGRPPSSARCQVAICVSRLRKQLGPEAILTESPGYRIPLAPGGSDWSRFGVLAAEARERVAAGDRAGGVAALREALALWGGMPFEDVPGLAPDSERLQAVRLDTAEECAELELELGRHDRVSEDLAPLVAEHPLRERARALLMLARQRAGRRADALQVYQDGRRALVDLLGIEPGQQLHEAHQTVLRDCGDVAPVVDTPSQLPRQPVPFVGRATELAVLDRLLDDDRDAPGAVVLCGSPEVGKSGLALRWAHHRAERYPDGQLYASLTGEDGRAVAPETVLDQFLRALGVVDLPADLAERTALYRSTVARRRLLVVLDDAVDDAQVAPLVPGGRHTRLVVTSRAPMEEFVARFGAHQQPVGPLPHEVCHRLLATLLGSDWIRTRPQEVLRIARQAGGLPLPLRRAAARLRLAGASGAPGEPVPA